MEMGLYGKRVLVTGLTRGIGRAIAVVSHTKADVEWLMVAAQILRSVVMNPQRHT